MQEVTPTGPVRPEDVPFDPIHDCLLVQEVRVAESAIVMPDIAEGETKCARVIKVGPGRVLEFNGATVPLEQIRAGDVVVMLASSPVYAPVPLDWKGYRFYILRARDVMAVRRDIPWGAASGDCGKDQFAGSAANN